ncbi:protein FMP52-2, mitochondrial [Scheffersomyces xylosifermentans]|uniref:protein FMP52-2, mitochondrial n=1 Tax=Scheffersomyces xylosifermentans TaxID=1304137 RepID=UPI00315DFB18
MAGAFVLGATGLCGLQMLKFAEKSHLYDRITTISRRLPDAPNAKLNAILESDLDKWPEIIASESKGCKTFYSGFGTTRGAAGSQENYYRLDYGVVYDAAKAAKAAGVETFVFVTAAFSNANSRFSYIRTKGQLEDDIIALKFPRTIILRPGMLLGKRDSSRSYLEHFLINVLKYTHGNVLSNLTFPAYGEEIGQIAVNLASEPLPQNSGEPIVKIVGAKEITQLASRL